MDTWSDRQLAFMKAGGNDRAKEWLERYNAKESDMKNKYSSPVFEAYREKLKATVENRKYTDPSPEEMAKRASPYGSRNGSPSVGSNSGLNSSRGGNEFGQMSRSSELYASGTQRPNTMSSSGGYGNGSSNANGGYNNGGGYSNGSAGFSNSNGGYSNGGSANGHQRNGSASGSFGYDDSPQDMQTRFAGRKAIGSHDFQPSGSSRSSPGPQGSNGDDELMSALYDGWSRFSTGVKQAASTAAEKVSSGAITDEVSSLATKVTASQTWNYVASFFGGDEEGNEQGGSQQQRGPAQTQYARGSHQQQSRDDRGGFGSEGGRDANDYGRDDPRSSDPRGARQQPSYSGGGDQWGSSRQESRVVGEKQGLRFEQNDPVRRPQSHPVRATNGWGGNNDDWDDWDHNEARKGKTNPHVSIAEDDIEVDEYKAPAKSLAAPQPTRPAAHAPAPVQHDDIYDFQIGSSSKPSTPATVSAPASTKPVGAGWDDWEDWGRSK